MNPGWVAARMANRSGQAVEQAGLGCNMKAINPGSCWGEGRVAGGKASMSWNQRSCREAGWVGLQKEWQQSEIRWRTRVGWVATGSLSILGHGAEKVGLQVEWGRASIPGQAEKHWNSPTRKVHERKHIKCGDDDDEITHRPITSGPVVISLDITCKLKSCNGIFRYSVTHIVQYGCEAGETTSK